MACTCGKCIPENIICSQVGIPTVDNTVLDCKDSFFEQCVLMTTVRTTPIAIAINDTLQETIDKLLQKIIDMEAQILVLENYNITNP